MENLKATIIALLLFVLIVAGIFYINYLDVKAYEDIVWVAKEFSYFLMLGEPRGMRHWASKELIKRIEKTKYHFIEAYSPSPEEGYKQYDYEHHAMSIPKQEDLDIVSLKSFGSTVVCTCALTYPTIMIYSVVLEPSPIRTYWENLLENMHFVPVLGNYVEHSEYKTRWHVVDYYTQSDYAGYVKNDNENLKLLLELSPSLEASYWKENAEQFTKHSFDYYENINKKAKEQEEEWAKNEIIRQNKDAADLINRHIWTSINKEEERADEELLIKYYEKAK